MDRKRTKVGEGRMHTGGYNTRKVKMERRRVRGDDESYSWQPQR
jgi:hypothetical protein